MTPRACARLMAGIGAESAGMRRTPSATRGRASLENWRSVWSAVFSTALAPEPGATSEINLGPRRTTSERNREWWQPVYAGYQE